MTRLLHIHVNNDVQPTLVIRDYGCSILERALPVRSQILRIVNFNLINLDEPAGRLKNNIARRPLCAEANEFSLVLIPWSVSLVKQDQYLQKTEANNQAECS